MKYIRTKDGKIYNINDLHISEDLVGKPYVTNKGSWCIYRESIIKQADTIEELCDEYVAVGIPFRTFIVDLNELKRSGLDIHSFSRACYMQYKNCAIYGAVYTDKGLIYVAKMNDKGELELL